MKRSQRFRMMATRAYWLAFAWASLATSAASLGYAYRENGWPLCLIAVAFLMLVFAISLVAEGLNKSRLSRVERQWEKRREIRSQTQSL